MLGIVNISDYEDGLMCISTNKHNTGELQSYIDRYDEQYLLDLLGCELFELFKSDLVDGVPQDQRFLDIYNRICIDDFNYCHGRLLSLGIKEMLKRFIYFEYVRQQKVYNTVSGFRVDENETSRESVFDESNIYSFYNEAIEYYWAIQYYIIDNEVNYPEFEGIYKKKTSWL